MSKQIILSMWLAVLLAFADSARADPERPSSSSVCQSRENGAINEGAVLRLAGKYVYVAGYEEYLIDDRCQAGVMDLDTNESAKSILRFRDLRKSECASRGKEALCNLIGELDVTGIIKSYKGRVYLSAKEINSFSWKN